MKSINLLTNKSYYLSSLVLFLSCTLSFNALSQDKKWYDKSFEDILNSRVVTATRTQSTLKNVPGVVTVFSGDEIQMMGLRSIKEVLERTTGFFVTKQLTGTTVGSRGYLGNTDQFLLLIDGHNMNSIVDGGMGQQFLFPNLNYVERIEIIRGPGSTLWGSDAALGIIHVITKNGSDIDGLTVTANASNSDNLRSLNILGGKEVTDDIHIMASFTSAASDGFEPKKHGDESLDLVGDWDEIEESFEFYTKAQVKNITIKARAYDTKISRPYVDIFNTYGGTPAYTRRNHYYLDITHEKNINSDFSVESRFFMDNMQRIQVLMSPRYSSSAKIGQESESSQENAMGVEFIARWSLDSHELMFGYRGVETQLSPWSYKVEYPVHSTATTPPGTITQFVVPESNDLNQALFIEDQWELIPNVLSAVMGVRLDDNNLRENNLIILPRLAINWQTSTNWQMKYSYNTGYIRPSVGVGFLGQLQFVADPTINKPVMGATESEEIATHDFQIIFSKDRLRTNINFYHNAISKPAQIIFDDAIIDGKDVKVFYANVNDVETYGIELELSYLVTENIDIYFNASKVLSAKSESMTGKTNGYDFDLNKPYLDPVWGPFIGEQRGFSQSTYMQNGEVQGFPLSMINLGVNWSIMTNLKSNLHLRAWDDMNMREPTYDANNLNAKYDLDAQVFVDFNLLYTNILDSNFDASFYVKNVLDNSDAEAYLYLFSNTWVEQGRRVGASVAYKF